uniref:WD repeat domain 90 n=1 Tax=Cyanistes caeruleus TaxID=156563 RepID=A0A8C0VFW5_CYACU
MSLRLEELRDWRFQGHSWSWRGLKEGSNGILSRTLGLGGVTTAGGNWGKEIMGASPGSHHEIDTGAGETWDMQGATGAGDLGAYRGQWGAWQRPYLNIFKHFRVEEWKRSAKEGDVAALTDTRLKGTIYRIRGSNPASSYLQLPRAGTQSLGLTGRYFYLFFRPLPRKHFLVHLDVTTEENQVVRISFSNLFKEFKSTATWLQFPFVCRAASEGTARRDLVGIFTELQECTCARWVCCKPQARDLCFSGGKWFVPISRGAFRQLPVPGELTVCVPVLPGVTLAEARLSDLSCPGVAPMPREFAFPVPKGQKWHDLYDYIRYGCSDPTAAPRPPHTPGKGRIKLLNSETPAPAASLDSARLNALKLSPLTGETQSCLCTSERAEPRHWGAPWREDPSLALNMMVLSGFLFQGLVPDPILKLRTIIGFGGCNSKWALWTRDSTAVVYPCHAVIVTLLLKTGEQRFFLGHTDKVSVLAFSGSSTLLASAQAGPRSVGRLWDFPTGTCLCLFKTYLQSLVSLSFSHSGAVLCGVGRDVHSKTMVVVWNTAQVTRGGSVTVLTKTHTDVDIQAMKIAFFDDTRMVSCGRDNIRLWRVRSGALRSCPVRLGEYHSLDFTDLTFVATSCCPTKAELFVCSRSGHVLEVDYKNVCVRSARRLLPAQPQEDGQEQAGNSSGGSPGIAINSISMSLTFCATGSEDGYMRLWPLDFSAAVLEAEHEASVSSVCISPDRHKVLSTTATGNVGYLDIQSRGYNTLMRSHEDSVLGFSVEGKWRQIATVSQDNTIRVWDLASRQQLYDFSAAEETPCTVAFHPSWEILACGFDSGVVRTFSLTASDLLLEHKQHRTAITGLTFSPDGNLMFSSCLQGTLALYSFSARKIQVLRVLGSVVARDAGGGVDTLVVSGDSRLLAFVGPSKYVVTVMEACSLDELLRVDISILGLHSTILDSAVKVCFGPVPQGELLVSTSSNKILVLDAKTGRLVSPVRAENFMSLWEWSNPILTGQVVMGDSRRALSQVFIGHSEPVRQVAFTPDQEHVISVGDAIFLWDFLAPPPVKSSPASHSLGAAPKPFSGAASHRYHFLLCVAEPRKGTKTSKSQCSIRPDSYRHFTPRFKASVLPQSFLSPPAGSEVLKLKAVIGYNGNGRGNMVWNPDTGFFAYSCGCVIVVEDLHSGSQNHWLGHAEEISTLALSHNAQVLASASGKKDGDSHCQICIWSIQDGACTAELFHHETQVQAMAFSWDDRFLVTIGDYSDQTMALWSTHTYELMLSTHILEPLHDMAFSPVSHQHLACVGRGAVMFWLLEQQGDVHRAPAPDVLGLVELTSLCYGADALLYSGTNSGQICVWDTETNSCFMTWEADEGEIGVLVCRHNRLVSGSNTKRIRLWFVATVQELRLKGPDARSGSVVLEHEITLDGTIVSAAFDDSLEMGIVGTTAGTLWYINWVESTSIRLISGHKNKVTEVCFSPDESHCATCGEDGSVRIWALGSTELVVQFQVLNQSCQCLAWKPRPVGVWPCPGESQHVVAGYSDGTVRVFSVSRTEMELKMHPHAAALTAITYSTDGEMILSGGKDGIVAVSSPRTGMTIHVLADHKGSPITVLQCTRKQYHDFGVEGGELWLAASSDRRVSVWASDWLQDKCELLDWLSFPAPAGPEVSMAPGLDSLPPSLAAFCPWEHGVLVYVGFGLQKEALFYSLRKKQVLRKIPLPAFATSLSLSPAAPFMAIGFGGECWGCLGPSFFCQRGNKCVLIPQETCHQTWELQFRARRNLQETPGSEMRCTRSILLVHRQGLSLE